MMNGKAVLHYLISIRYLLDRQTVRPPLACVRVYGCSIALVVGRSGGGVIPCLRVRIERQIERARNRTGVKYCQSVSRVSNQGIDTRHYWSPTE